MHREVVELGRGQLVQREGEQLARRAARVDRVDDDEAFGPDLAQRQGEEHPPGAGAHVQEAEPAPQRRGQLLFELPDDCGAEPVIPEEHVAAAQHQDGLAAELGDDV